MLCYLALCWSDPPSRPQRRSLPSAPSDLRLSRHLTKTPSFILSRLGTLLNSQVRASLIFSVRCGTLCEKHPGVGPVQSPQIAPLRRPLNPMESHCFAKCVRNHFRITLFRKTPGGGGLRTSPLSPIRHFAHVNAKLILPARSLLGGAW